MARTALFTTPAESDSARLTEITAQLAEDVRPLVERLSAVPGAARPLLEKARPMADVFAAELSPLLNDLRPVARAGLSGTRDSATGRARG